MGVLLSGLEGVGRICDTMSCLTKPIMTFPYSSSHTWYRLQNNVSRGFQGALDHGRRHRERRSQNAIELLCEIQGTICKPHLRCSRDLKLAQFHELCFDQHLMIQPLTPTLVGVVSLMWKLMLHKVLDAARRELMCDLKKASARACILLCQFNGVVMGCCQFLDV